MSKALSFDLRVRVPAAVAAGGGRPTGRPRSDRGECRQRKPMADEGMRTRRSPPKGVGRRSDRIEADHDVVLAALAPDRGVIPSIEFQT